MFPLLYSTVPATSPLLMPLCFVMAWTFLVLLVWSTWLMIRDAIYRSRQMHKVPCAGCQFFTKDYHLKCTVHPDIALSEKAIGCPDYQARTDRFAVPSVTPSAIRNKQPV